MEFHVLGPLEVVRHGRTLELGAGKQRTLLAALLLHANEVVSTDRLIDALWGEEAARHRSRRSSRGTSPGSARPSTTSGLTGRAPESAASC